MLKMSAAAATPAAARDPPSTGAALALTQPVEHPCLEPGRRFGFGRELRDHVGRFGELGDVGLAARAAVDVQQHLGALGAARIPRASSGASSRTSAHDRALMLLIRFAPRSRVPPGVANSAVRIRVLAVPSGMSSISPTSACRVARAAPRARRRVTAPRGARQRGAQAVAVSSESSAMLRRDSRSRRCGVVTPGEHRVERDRRAGPAPRRSPGCG